MEQLSIFGEKPSLKITKPVRLIELFGGIGAQAKALENLGVPFEKYKLVEFDEHAVASYNAVHHTQFMTKDITQTHAADLDIVDTDKYEYIMTYSFPCQDLSVAGHQRGMKRGSGTRSGLLWEVERILDECKELPQILLMENVSTVIGEKNRPDFDRWTDYLESKGYTNEFEIINAADYGLPQHRERCFMVSFLGNYSFTFPAGTAPNCLMEDYLEPEVPNRYYLPQKSLEGFTRTEQSMECNCNRYGLLAGLKYDIAKRVYDPKGSCPCITVGGDGTKIVERINGTNRNGSGNNTRK